MPPRTLWATLMLGAGLAVVMPGLARAQFANVSGAKEKPIRRDQPVYYTADSVEYDRDRGLVTLSGHVEIWQDDRVLRADKVTYDRNTGVAAARGNVVLLDPSGQVLFADYAELSQGMKDGILSNIRSQMAENGRLAANGARRTDARVNDLSRVIYSTCDACKNNPDGPLEWDIRARSAVQDVDHKLIEYKDAVVDLYGVPVMWMPYFTTPDPSQKRASGFLVPDLGYSKYLGAFVEVPYYWVIDGSTDATITPILTSGANGPGLNTQIRHAFNSGVVNANTSMGYDEGSVQGDIFATGRFDINDEWRWGFDVQRSSSLNYMRDFALPGLVDVLTSDIYLESFGQGSYSRLDASTYQGLVTSLAITAELPVALPHYEYSFVGEPDALGGRLALDAGAFNVLRQEGANTQRTSLSLNWERPATGALGDLWKLVLHVDGAAYNTSGLNQQPSWGASSAASTMQAMPTVALEMRWPLMRDAGKSGTQIIEPIIQLIGAPQGSSYASTLGLNGTRFLKTLIPNEDAFDFQFTDANLFALNRFGGIDRLEGGPRANVALHGAWYFGDGQTLDALIGQGYRTAPAPEFPVGSGLSGTVTDVVSHLDYTPNQYLDFTSRQRFSHYDLALDFADALATVGPSWLKFSGGYIYNNHNPYFYYDTAPTGYLTSPPVNELTFGVNTTLGHWNLNAFARRDMQLQQMVDTGAILTYTDECLIFSANYFRRYTSINFDNGATMLLFQITLKTVGTFGFNGM